MATIDLIVLGILKKEPMGAYDIQKLVEYRNISKWVKISTPSIYKKAIQLEEKGFIKGEIVKEGKMPEKAVYSLTDEGEKEFVKLMMETASKPIHFFLDFNAVIVNLDKLPPESQQSCIASIEENIEILKTYLEENLREKENDPEIPKTGMAVLQQQIVLADAIEKWIIPSGSECDYSSEQSGSAISAYCGKDAGAVTKTDGQHFRTGRNRDGCRPMFRLCSQNIEIFLVGNLPQTRCSLYPAD